MTAVVLATVTHDNLRGLQSVVASLLRRSRELDAEVFVVANAPPETTRNWLDRQASAISVKYLPVNLGPGAGRNVVVSERSSARAYIFVDDDVLVEGSELNALLTILDSDQRIGIASGMPTTDTGEPMASGFSWRPLDRAFPGVWERWWGSTSNSGLGSRVDADRVSSSMIAIRGAAARACGGFDPVFWPGCHEDTDFCARIRFAGYRIVVDPRLEIRQEVSVTTRKLFGPRHLAVCRSTGIIYAAIDYPASFALGRCAEAAVRSFVGPRRVRRADAEGLIRCAENWQHILHRRIENRKARDRRRGPVRPVSVPNELSSSRSGALVSLDRHPSQFAYPRGFGGRVVGIFLAIANEWMADLAIEMLKPDADARVLEIGFGPGVAIRKLCEAMPGGKVCGVDPSKVMVRQAIRRNRSSVLRGQADLRLGSATALPWTDGSFDAVLSLNNAHLWDPVDVGFTECRRVLRPSGRVLIGFHIWRTRGESSGRLSSLHGAEAFLGEHLTANGFVPSTPLRRDFRIGTASFVLGTRR